MNNSNLTFLGNLYVDKNIDIKTNNNYLINSIPTLTPIALGNNIINSSLTSVGAVSSLNISGQSIVGNLTASNISLTNLIANNISSIIVNSATLPLLTANGNINNLFNTNATSSNLYSNNSNITNFIGNINSSLNTDSLYLKNILLTSKITAVNNIAAASSYSSKTSFPFFLQSIFFSFVNNFNFGFF